MQSASIPRLEEVDNTASAVKKRLYRDRKILKKNFQKSKKGSKRDRNIEGTGVEIISKKSGCVPGNNNNI